MFYTNFSRALFFALLFCFSASHALIKDVHAARDIFAPLTSQVPVLADGTPITPKDLVIFDLDNTLIEPDNDDLFGGDAWLMAHAQRTTKESGWSFDKAFHEISLPKYLEIQQTLPLRLVEPVFAGYIRALQDGNVPVIALTSRSQPVLDRTLAEITRLGVSFARHPISKTSVTFNAPYPVIWQDGILFVKDNKKDMVLEQFLAAVGGKPEKIIFIDDKLKYVQEIDSLAGKLGIASYAYRYGFLDAKISAYKKRVEREQSSTQNAAHGIAFYIFRYLIAMLLALAMFALLRTSWKKTRR